MASALKNRIEAADVGIQNQTTNQRQALYRIFCLNFCFLGVTEPYNNEYTDHEGNQHWENKPAET